MYDTIKTTLLEEKQTVGHDDMTIIIYKQLHKFQKNVTMEQKVLYRSTDGT